MVRLLLMKYGYCCVYASDSSKAGYPYCLLLPCPVSSALGGLCVMLEWCLLEQVGMFGDNANMKICGQSWKHVEPGLCSKPLYSQCCCHKAVGHRQPHPCHCD